MTLSSKFFDDPKRTDLILFAQEHIEKIIDLMANIPTGDETNYRTAVVSANLVWFRSLLHIANPNKFKKTVIANVNQQMSYTDFIKWRDQMVEKLGSVAPSQQYTVTVFTQQLMHNGYKYVG